MVIEIWLCMSNKWRLLTWSASLCLLQICQLKIVRSKISWLSPETSLSFGLTIKSVRYNISRFQSTHDSVVGHCRGKNYFARDKPSSIRVFRVFQSWIWMNWRHLTSKLHDIMTLYWFSSKRPVLLWIQCHYLHFIVIKHPYQATCDLDEGERYP